MADDQRSPTQDIEPEIFLKRYRDIGDKARLSDKAKAAWKAECEKAFASGINGKALKLVNKLRKMEPRDAQSLMRDTVRYLRWLGLNILDQEELLADTPSTAGLTSFVLASHAVWEAGSAGYSAGKTGKPIDENPFAPGTETHQRWASEWLDGHADAEGLAQLGAQEIQPRSHDGDENPEEESDDRLP